MIFLKHQRCCLITNRPAINVWQKSFYDEIIRNQTAYDEISKYIYENPMNWELDELFINN